MSIMIQDSFTDTNGVLLENHTSEIGSWTTGSSPSFVIQSGKIKSSDTTSYPYYDNSVLAIFSYVQCDYDVSGASSGGNASEVDIDIDAIVGNLHVALSKFDFTTAHAYLSGYDSMANPITATITGLALTGTLKLSYESGNLVLYVGGIFKGQVLGVEGTNGSSRVHISVGANGTIDNLTADGTLPAPPIDPTLLTTTCIAGIGESTLGNKPLASFTATPVSGSAPLSVSFADHSTNTPTSWLWEFGDGSTSTSQNPSHTFAAGTYTVRLTATNAQGSSSFQMTIISLPTPVVTPPPVGTVTPVGVVPGETIQSLLGKIGYYAVDTNENQINIYDSNGALLKSFGGVGSDNGKFFLPTTCCILNGRQLIDRVVIEET